MPGMFQFQRNWFAHGNWTENAELPPDIVYHVRNQPKIFVVFQIIAAVFSVTCMCLGVIQVVKFRKVGQKVRALRGSVFLPVRTELMLSMAVFPGCICFSQLLGLVFIRQARLVLLLSDLYTSTVLSRFWSFIVGLFGGAEKVAALAAAKKPYRIYVAAPLCCVGALFSKRQFAAKDLRYSRLAVWQFTFLVPIASLVRAFNNGVVNVEQLLNYATALSMFVCMWGLHVLTRALSPRLRNTVGIRLVVETTVIGTRLITVIVGIPGVVPRYNEVYTEPVMVMAITNFCVCVLSFSMAVLSFFVFSAQRLHMAEIKTLEKLRSSPVAFSNSQPSSGHSSLSCLHSSAKYTGPSAVGGDKENEYIGKVASSLESGPSNEETTADTSRCGNEAETPGETKTGFALNDKTLLGGFCSVCMHDSRGAYVRSLLAALEAHMNPSGLAVHVAASTPCADAYTSASLGASLYQFVNENGSSILAGYGDDDSASDVEKTCKILERAASSSQESIDALRGHVQDDPAPLSLAIPILPLRGEVPLGGVQGDANKAAAVQAAGQTALYRSPQYNKLAVSPLQYSPAATHGSSYQRKCIGAADIRLNTTTCDFLETSTPLASASRDWRGDAAAKHNHPDAAQDSKISGTAKLLAGLRNCATGPATASTGTGTDYSGTKMPHYPVCSCHNQLGAQCVVASGINTRVNPEPAPHNDMLVNVDPLFTGEGDGGGHWLVAKVRAKIQNGRLGRIMNRSGGGRDGCAESGTLTSSQNVEDSECIPIPTSTDEVDSLRHKSSKSTSNPTNRPSDFVGELFVDHELKQYTSPTTKQNTSPHMLYTPQAASSTGGAVQSRKINTETIKESRKGNFSKSLNLNFWKSNAENVKAVHNGVPAGTDNKAPRRDLSRSKGNRSSSVEGWRSKRHTAIQGATKGHSSAAQHAAVVRRPQQVHKNAKNHAEDGLQRKQRIVAPHSAELHRPTQGTLHRRSVDDSNIPNDLHLQTRGHKKLTRPGSLQPSLRPRSADQHSCTNPLSRARDVHTKKFYNRPAAQRGIIQSESLQPTHDAATQRSRRSPTAPLQYTAQRVQAQRPAGMPIAKL